MKAKDKAKELVERFKYRTLRGVEVETMSISLAKQCALICVDEIIINGGTKNVIQYEPNCFTNKVDYWKEVKQEIEKL